ncbi:MAG: GntR family transcriptional regulator [Bryobacteraceae bacterium]
MRQKDSSARERAYEYIQGKILSGQWSGGTVLSELALSKEMAISRTPIREAVRQLAGEGFLEQAPNRVMAVASLTRADIADLYELREAIEVYAVGKAARFVLSAAHLERLRGFLNECESLVKDLEVSGQGRLDEGQMQQFINADLGFHTLLLHTAANRRMLKLVSETRLLIRIFSIRRDGHSAGQLRAINRQHAAILDAVASGRGEEAKAVLAEHIRVSGEERMEAYDHWEREGVLNGFSKLLVP